MATRARAARPLPLGLRMALLPALLAACGSLLLTASEPWGRRLGTALAVGLVALLGLALPIEWLRRRGAAAPHAGSRHARSPHAGSGRRRSR